MLFFEPTLEGFGDALGNPTTADSLTPWEGMLGFDRYCQGGACPAE
jgi:hypothetical protein